VFDWKPEIKQRLANLKLDPTREAAIVEELAQYLDDYYAELLAGAATEAEAYRQTLTELHGSELLAQELRRAERQVAPEPIVLGTNRRTNMIADLWQDLRFGARMLLKQPGFTSIVVITLALGIGATTTVFSLVNGYLLRPLPFATAERLLAVEVGENAPVGFNDVQWAGAAEVFEQIIAWDLDSFSLTGTPHPEAVNGAWVTPGFFTATGTRPALGRAFLAEEAGPNGQPVAVISHGLWQRRFGGNPNVIGRTLTVSSSDRPEQAEIVTIIGVLAPDFWFFHAFTEMLLPLRGNRMPSMATLKPGVTSEQAGLHLTNLVRAQAQKVEVDWGMRLLPARDAYVREVRATLWLLLAAVGSALLIACSNAVFLLLVRTTGREKELAIRRALGAGRWRIVRQLLTESLLLTLLAGMLGIALAQFGLDLLGQVIETQLGSRAPGGASALKPDFTALLVAAAISLLITVLFAFVPALARGGAKLTAALNEAGRGATDRARWIRNTLVTIEIAVSLALLIGAGLLVRSALRLNRLELGFDADNVLRANFSLPLRQYPSEQSQQEFSARLLSRVQQMPGVESASVTNMPPFRVARGWPIEVEGRSANSDRDAVRAVQQSISPEYFQTMRIPVLRGRAFTERDRAGAEPVIIISEQLADKLWPNEDPLGKRLKNSGNMTGERVWRTVVGVVREARKTLTAAHFPDTYIPMRQNPRAFFYLMTRTSGDALGFLPELQRVVWEMDADLPISEISAMREIVARAGARSRFLAALLAGFALFAVVLAMLGVYGVVAYAVSQRGHEIAIRLALGAEARDVIHLFLKQGMGVVATGVGLGLLIAWLLSSALSAQIYGVTTTDPLTFAVASCLLALVALSACYIPARRVAKVDPMTALRAE
jgi:putative ABC transport system permease protein